MQNEYNLKLEKSNIKKNIFIFIRLTLPNPVFDNQLHEKLIKFTKGKNTVKLRMEKRFIERIMKSKIGDKIINKKEEKKSLIKVDDLRDSLWEGTKPTLVLVEGRSAMAFAKAGIEVIDRGTDMYDVHMLNGTMLNVRGGTTEEQISNNKRINNLMKII